MSKPLRDYTDPAEIRERLTVLRAKLRRVVNYQMSAGPDGVRDVSLLDEKQRQHVDSGGPFPAGVGGCLANTIRMLEERLSEARP